MRTKAGKKGRRIIGGRKKEKPGFLAYEGIIDKKAREIPGPLRRLIGLFFLGRLLF
jgi:hypothetical protein